MTSVLSVPPPAVSPAFDWSNWLRPRVPTPEAVTTLSGATAVVVYGAGSVAEGLIELLSGRSVKIRAVIDAKTQREQIAEHLVFRPNSAEFSLQERASLPVVLGLFNAFVDISALARELDALGWKNIIHFEDLHAALPHEFGDRYWLTHREHTAAHITSIADVDQLWADDVSRETYRGLLRFRASGDRSGLRKPDPVRQYFADDVPAWQTPLRFVDCGACDGDTVKQVQQLGLPIEAFAAFEPDLANFAPLVRTLSQLSNRGIPALAWPCGVGAETEVLRFRADRGAASALNAAGETVVPCVALDEVISGFRPNLIKMDIEGAEMDALNGARRTIERNRPGLAICVYHRPADLWELPALVASWKLGYRFYLRAHQYNGFDVVMYAIPSPA